VDRHAGAAVGAVELGFSYGLPEIHAVAWPGNDRLIAVMRRIGIQRVGRTTKWFARETEHYKISPAGIVLNCAA
jgi:RimJ/RimL family protein N-acetyltransferase